MRRRPQNKRQQPKRLLSRALRLEARYWVEGQIAELVPANKIEAEAVTRYQVSPQAAHRLYLDTWNGLRTAEAEDRPMRRGKMELVLENLYRKAWKEGKLQTCAQVTRQLKELFGLNAPIKVEQLGAGSTTPEDARSEAELDYYNTHGHWPEEAPRRAAPGDVPRDPLDRLH